MSEAIEGSSEYSRHDQTIHFLGALASRKEPMTIREIMRVMPVPVVKSLMKDLVPTYNPEPNHSRDYVVSYYANRGLVQYAGTSRMLELTEHGRKTQLRMLESLQARMPETIILSQE